MIKALYEAEGGTSVLLRVYAVLLVAIGAVLVYGGGSLILLGGSFYYLLAGAAVLVSGVWVVAYS